MWEHQGVVTSHLPGAKFTRLPHPHPWSCDSPVLALPRGAPGSSQGALYPGKGEIRTQTNQGDP